MGGNLDGGGGMNNLPANKLGKPGLWSPAEQALAFDMLTVSQNINKAMINDPSRIRWSFDLQDAPLREDVIVAYIVKAKGGKKFVTSAGRNATGKQWWVTGIGAVKIYAWARMPPPPSPAVIPDGNTQQNLADEKQ